MSGMMRGLGDIMTRLGLAKRAGETFAGDRDLYNSFGYRQNPSFDEYLAFYMRGDIAARVIDVAPKATWRHAPVIRSDDESFVDAIAELDDRLRLFHFLERVDEIAGIGQFGVLVIGTRGGNITDPPEGLNGTDDVVYLSAYHQGSVDVHKWDNDTESPRFGLPQFYEIDLAGTTMSLGNKGRESTTVKVPWERVIHVAENTIEDAVYGQPRLARVLNRIDDLFKVLGGSAELYWQNVAGIWHADVSPDVEVKSEDLDSFEDDMLAARHGFTKLLQTRGMDLSLVTGTQTDPKGTYDALKQVISAAAEIPERVLFGSERGQLAGDQDQKEWQAHIAARQEQFAEPIILRQTINRLIEIGALDAPTEPYQVVWPALDAPSTGDRADVAAKFASAIAAGAPAGAGDLIMPPWEFREIILGLDPLPPEIPDGFEFASGFEEEQGDETG